MWDSQMSTLSIHLDAMARYLPKKDSSYDELVRTGTYLHQRSGKIIVPNAEFATDHSTNGTLVVGTWSAPTSIKAGNTTPMPDKLVDRYQLGPELLLKKDFDLMQEYLKSITDEEEQDDYESRCNRSGAPTARSLGAYVQRSVSPARGQACPALVVLPLGFTVPSPRLT